MDEELLALRLPEKVRIRKARKRDIPHIVELAKGSGSLLDREHIVKETLNYIFVAEHGEKGLIGQAFGRPLNKGSMELGGLVVHPDYRKKSAADPHNPIKVALLVARVRELFERQMLPISVNLLERNERSQLYAKLGFRFRDSIAGPLGILTHAVYKQKKPLYDTLAKNLGVSKI